MIAHSDADGVGWAEQVYNGLSMLPILVERIIQSCDLGHGLIVLRGNILGLLRPPYPAIIL